MSKPLFDEFQDVSSKTWKQKIQVDLKGADYNDTLIWKTHEGIDVKPFYHADQFETFTAVPSGAWCIGQAVEVTDTATANQNALEAITKGAESITFIVTSETTDADALCKGIDPEKTPVTIVGHTLSEAPISGLKAVNIHCDIIHHLAKTGNWYDNLKADHQRFEAIVKQTQQLSVDMSLYQNAGASIVQQLAYGMAHANEYLNHLDTLMTKDQKAALKVTFKTAVGTNYFFEIAKLRALRLLWQTLAAEYGYSSHCHIVTTPTKRNKTLYDYNTNMLRTTTECMSAIVGGSDEVINTPYDDIYHHSNDFGERISRNQLLVLKHESYFDKVHNVADGSYYIERLTTQLATKALELFKDIEANGGFLHQLKAGTIQKKIKESADKEQEDFDTGKLVLLGTNKHPNPQDTMKQDLEKDPFLKVDPRKTLIAPILEKRLAEAMERQRLNEE